MREDARLLKGLFRFGNDTLDIHDLINILRIEVDSKLSFERDLENVSRKAFLRVINLRQIKHLSTLMVS